MKAPRLALTGILGLGLLATPLAAVAQPPLENFRFDPPRIYRSPSTLEPTTSSTARMGDRHAAAPASRMPAAASGRSARPGSS